MQVSIRRMDSKDALGSQLFVSHKRWTYSVMVARVTYKAIQRPPIAIVWHQMLEKILYE